MIFLLGKRDIPVDGIEDYCNYLGEALERRGIPTTKARVNWDEDGWARALRRLWVESAAWRERWVLLQYTAMAWSRRGLPFGALAVLEMLRRRGIRCAMTFHEPVRQEGQRWRDHFRGGCQDWVIRELYSRAAKAIFADPLDKIPWLPSRASKATFIPIGANIPEPIFGRVASFTENGAVKTVVVYCLSTPPNREREVGDVAYALRSAARNGSKLRLVFLGRGTESAQEAIRRAFERIPVEISNLGLRDSKEVSRTLADADVMLCVRGRLYPRRGSAIAGIACGLPIVGYSGAAEQTPLAEAGVELVPYGDRTALAAALLRVLDDDILHAELRQRSRRAQEKYFSWNEIANRYVEVLRLGTTTATGAH